VARRSVKYLLVGGGIASANCARHLREQGADGEILLVGRELDPPYNRPPLSKQYVRGEETMEDIIFRPASWYEENDVEVLTRTSVTGLDVGAHTATLSNKDGVSFEKALLATGANVRLLHVGGSELDGIHYLRTVRNADALREELQQAERVALVGGSYIATELAASFTALGKQCELIMLEEVTLERFYGREVGRFFQNVLTEHGVKAHGSQELDRFEGDGGRVRRLVTKAGLEVECDFVVIGAGVHPDIRIAEKAGIETDSGVLAAGDMCEYESPLHDARLRLEHWDVAFNHGKTAALNMLGRSQPHDVVPYFWSDLADWSSMEYVGPASYWDEIWWRGRPEDGKFTAWYLKAGRVVAALTVGRSDDLAVAARLLSSRVDVSDKRSSIEDPETDLSALVPSES
jgi:3-phenylpropionate/trans-cinnamate dioxygenase ferredoxin reductase component